MAANESEESDEFVQECLAGWTPRFLVNGVAYGDLERIKKRIHTWEDWCPAFRSFGDMHVELGDEALDRANHQSAARHYVDAAMCYHFGSYVWHVDDDFRDETHRLAVEYFKRGGQFLDPPVERLEAPTGEGFSVPGNLRVPDRSPDGTDGASPLVLLMPGLDSIKEEMSVFDPIFHDRGIATLALEGPAQGEMQANIGMTPECHRYFSTMIDHVEELDPSGVDTSRIGAMGMSLGGFYAPYTAAHDDRIDACVGVSGGFTIGPVSGRASELSKEQFLWACRTDSMIEVDEITEQMSLRDCIDDLTAPSLMITGAKDEVVPPEQTERIARRAPNGEYVLYEEGNHVCNNIPYKYQPLVGDWLSGHLS